MASKKKKQKYSLKLTKELLSIIGRPFYLVVYYSGAVTVFIVSNIVKGFKGSKEEIIYKSKDFRKKHKPKVFSVNVTFFRKINSHTKLKILVALVLLVAISVCSIWYFIFRGLPSPSDLTNRKIEASTRIYDRNGILLYQIYKDQNRTPVSLGEIPENVKMATIASEDANFYSEHGFSLKGIIRSLFTDITNRDFSSGGSTITQQLIKNALLTSEKTISRKVKELVLSVEVENSFSKDEILEMYLNEIPYGGSAYGIEAASQQYFGKHVSDLDLAQAALLAGLTRSPTTYSPYGINPDLAIVRQKQVLELMAENGFITRQQENEALTEKLTFVNNLENIKAPHFVMYVRQKLVDEYGEEEVESGGLTVVTTLDYNIQTMAQTVVASEVAKLNSLHVTNGAAIVIDPQTGEILAMVGSKDYFDNANDGNVNVVTSLRPPGSSIKVVNYAYALSHGYTPATIILDAPITYKFTGSAPYSPVNYDGKFVGNISLRNALAQSRNIPAVKVLASYGVNNMIEMGQKMGITTWNEQNTYGLSLTLGGGATRLIDLARVFATIADYGTRPPVNSLISVTDSKGNKLAFDCDTGNCNSENILDPRVSYQLINILSDNAARAPEFGQYSSLVIPNHPEVAAKTGTSNDLRDNLTIGFNKNYLTAVWVGNNDNSPMSRIASGITGAAPIWNEIMKNLLGDNKSEQWNIPDGIKSVSCRGKNEFFLSETDTKNLCDIKEGTPSATPLAN